MLKIRNLILCAVAITMTAVHYQLLDYISPVRLGANLNLAINITKSMFYGLITVYILQSKNRKLYLLFAGLDAVALSLYTYNPTIFGEYNAAAEDQLRIVINAVASVYYPVYLFCVVASIGYLSTNIDKTAPETTPETQNQGVVEVVNDVEPAAEIATPKGYTDVQLKELFISNDRNIQKVMEITGLGYFPIYRRKVKNKW